jgi:hypothetical protein
MSLEKPRADNGDERGRLAIRDLARKVADLARSDENACRQQLWRDFNSLRKPQRAPIRCDPPLHALIPVDTVISSAPLHVRIEYTLRGWFWT